MTGVFLFVARRCSWLTWFALMGCELLFSSSRLTVWLIAVFMVWLTMVLARFTMAFLKFVLTDVFVVVSRTAVTVSLFPTVCLVGHGSLSCVSLRV